MNWKCDVIMDLVPLYQDGVASDASKRLVREHLRECKECRSFYRKCRPAQWQNPQSAFVGDMPDYALLAKKMLLRRVLLFVGFVSYVCASMGVLTLFYLRREKR